MVPDKPKMASSNVDHLSSPKQAASSHSQRRRKKLGLFIEVPQIAKASTHMQQGEDLEQPESKEQGMTLEM